MGVKTGPAAPGGPEEGHEIPPAPEGSLERAASKTPRPKPGRAKPGRPKSARPEPGDGGGPGLKNALTALEPALAPLAATLGLEVVGRRLATSSGRPVVRLIIDKPLPAEGPRPAGSLVTLDDCAAMSKAVSRLLDRIYPGDGPGYSLEVSSPGLDRPLSTEADFRRFHGALAKVALIVDGRATRAVGRLDTAEPPWRLITAKGELVFDLAMVKKARLAPEI